MSQPPINYHWPTTGVDELDRQNLTSAREQHPKDHDDLQRAVNALLYCLGDNPQGDQVTVTTRLMLLQSMVTSVQQRVTQAGLQDAILTAVSALDLAHLQLTHYVHYQAASADTWVVVHNLGFDPIVSVVRDSPVQVILGFELEYAVDHMSLTVGFSQAITGRLIASN